MTTLHPSTIDILRTHEGQLLQRWNERLATTTGRDRRIDSQELHQQSAEFLHLLLGDDGEGKAVLSGEGIGGELRGFLERLSRSRALQGFDSQHTANFIFSLKQPLFELLQQAYADQPEQLSQQLWAVSEVLDGLGMHTVQTFQRSREDIIKRQQEELLELSTPVVKLWDGILALPMIGTLDSQLTQVVMESLLQRIVETGAEIAIIDITGVPTVDTLVAQHLLKTVTAIRLMGADCIISGIRPQIAQTIVHLGLDLSGVATKANLADALALALHKTGLAVAQAA